jgi:hypothetical protein
MLSKVSRVLVDSFVATVKKSISDDFEMIARPLLAFAG